MSESAVLSVIISAWNVCGGKCLWKRWILENKLKYYTVHLNMHSQGISWNFVLSKKLITLKCAPKSCCKCHTVVQLFAVDVVIRVEVRPFPPHGWPPPLRCRPMTEKGRDCIRPQPLLTLLGKGELGLFKVNLKEGMDMRLLPQCHCSTFHVKHTNKLTELQLSFISYSE